MDRSIPILLIATLFAGACRTGKGNTEEQIRPNVVVIMGDDWSWPHASVLGDPVVRTPNFDRIAREGVLFENAFVSSPSCTPSRFAIASGQYHWRLGEGANLGGSLKNDVPVYPDLLSAAGYQTGFCRKGAAPSEHIYRETDPFGNRYKSFPEFIKKQKNGKPFCFWYGAGEPHRPYDWMKSKGSHLDLDAIEVPAYLPDVETTRIDLGDYYLRVEKLDHFAGEILSRLESSGLLENTIVVMTGDNGMPFPRAKATLYDSGTRVPLAIRHGAKIPPDRRINDYVSLVDLAPTFLEASGVPIPQEMSGRSLWKSLRSGKSGRIEADRDHVITGMEKHVYLRPARAIRTADFLYIRNRNPEDWPIGTIEGAQPVFDFVKTPWPTVQGAFSYNIDPGPTKQWMLQNDSPVNRFSFEPKPAEELYDLKKDPDQIQNLARNPSYSETVKILSSQLTASLQKTKDPYPVQ